MNKPQGINRDESIAATCRVCGAPWPCPMAGLYPHRKGHPEMSGYVDGGPAPQRTPKWRRELRLLRRDGPVKYVRTLRALRRFHRAVRRLP